MIDRKALWILILLCLAMTAAGFWRLSLLPDWHHMPVNGPGDRHTVNGLLIFWGSFALLLMMLIVFVRRWLVSGPEESGQPWRRWSTLILIANAMIVVLMQAFITARSLGFGQTIDRRAVAHTAQVAVGILMVMMGNALPKMPWLSARFRPFRLDPWQWNRQMRFVGKLMVGLGLFFALVPLLLPPRMAFPALAGAWLVTMMASFWHRTKVKREPSPPMT
ncbi:MAG TPA: hypothetical protein VJP60_06975 [Rhizomicrobium sp.]|nr:hypothetical protein [Rhizomicrobium sp.]